MDEALLTIENLSAWYGKDTLLRELSTRKRKKAFLLKGFALKPRLLLLDEPVNGIGDGKIRQTLSALSAMRNSFLQKMFS